MECLIKIKNLTATLNNEKWAINHCLFVDFLIIHNLVVINTCSFSHSVARSNMRKLLTKVAIMVDIRKKHNQVMEHVC